MNTADIRSNSQPTASRESTRSSEKSESKSPTSESSSSAQVSGSSARQEVERTELSLECRETPTLGVEAASKASLSLTGLVSPNQDQHATPVDHAHDHEHEHEQPLFGKLGKSVADALNNGASPATQAVIDSLETGEPQSFSNSNGELTEFQLQHLEASKGWIGSSHENYRFNLGEDSFDVQLAEGIDRDQALSRIIDYYSQQPENLREAVETIAVKTGQNPGDPHWAEVYNRPDFVSAATGGSGTITFWNGMSYLDETSFNHEFGHNIGSAVRELQNQESAEAGTLLQSQMQDLKTGDSNSPFVPRGASQAASSDGNAVSEYGQASIAEDFAEFYSQYRNASEEGPEALAHLKSRYPARYSLLVNEILSRHLEAA